MVQPPKYVKTSVIIGTAAILSLIMSTTAAYGQTEQTLIETENSYIAQVQDLAERDALEEVYSSMLEAKTSTGMDFILVQHEDLSVSLYATEDFITLTQIKGYANTGALLGPNGIADVLDKYMEYA